MWSKTHSNTKPTNPRNLRSSGRESDRASGALWKGNLGPII